MHAIPVIAGGNCNRYWSKTYAPYRQVPVCKGKQGHSLSLSQLQTVFALMEIYV